MTMKKIRAKHPKTQETFILHFESIEQAKKRNPYLIDFEYV